jgi:hypothetical protein
MADRAWDIINYRNAMEKASKPFYQDILANKGFSSQYKNILGAKTGEALGMSRLQDEDAIRKQVAGLGMTNTGLALRNFQNLGTGYAREFANSAKDTELESRNEYWRGIQGNEGLQGNLANLTAAYEEQRRANEANSLWGQMKQGISSGVSGLISSANPYDAISGGGKKSRGKKSSGSSGGYSL